MLRQWNQKVKLMKSIKYKSNLDNYSSLSQNLIEPELNLSTSFQNQTILNDFIIRQDNYWDNQ